MERKYLIEDKKIGSEQNGLQNGREKVFDILWNHVSYHYCFWKNVSGMGER